MPCRSEDDVTPDGGPVRRFRVPILALVAACIGLGIAATAQKLLRMDDRVAVVDTTTLRLGGSRIRLFGIEAPAIAQMCRDANDRPYACGRRAVEFVRRMLASRTVTCDTGYSATSAVCYADGRDIAAAMVRAGWAIHASGTHLYAADEAKAREERRGLWSGTFDTSWVPVGRTAPPAAGAAQPRHQSVGPTELTN